MFIFVGIETESQLKELKEKVNEVSKEMNLNNPTLDMVFHASLKNVFQVDSSLKEQIFEDIKNYFKPIKEFDVKVEKPTVNKNICWVKMQAPELYDIHDDLVVMLSKKYGVRPDFSDRNFTFHTTLFIKLPSEDIIKACNLLQDVDVPSVIKANKLLLGYSETGEFGTYVIQEIVPLNK